MAFKVPMTGIKFKIGGGSGPALSMAPKEKDDEVGAYVKTRHLYVENVQAKLSDFTYVPDLPLDVQIGMRGTWSIVSAR